MTLSGDVSARGRLGYVYYPLNGQTICLACPPLLWQGTDMTRTERRCRDCETILLFEDELDSDICEDCAKRAYHRDQKRREWDYYNPGEPRPDCELEE